MTDDTSFPNEDWCLDEIDKYENPASGKITLILRISKSRYQVDPEELSPMLEAFKRCMNMTGFSFYFKEEIFERARLSSERDEWKKKYEELKSHVDFMKEFIAPIRGKKE